MIIVGLVWDIIAVTGDSVGKIEVGRLISKRRSTGIEIGI